MSSSLISSAFLSLAIFLVGLPAEPPQDLGAPSPTENPKYDLAETRIEWVEGLDAALGRNRPILLFQVLGRFDDAFC